MATEETVPVRRLVELQFRSLNPGYPEVPVADDDGFHVIGAEASRIQRGGTPSRGGFLLRGLW